MHNSKVTFLLEVIPFLNSPHKMMVDIYHSVSLPTGWLARLTMDRPCLVPRPVFPPHPEKLCLRDVCNLSELPSNRTSGQVSVYEEKVCVRMYTCLTVMGFMHELWFWRWGYH